MASSLRLLLAQLPWYLRLGSSPCSLTLSHCPAYNLWSYILDKAPFPGYSYQYKFNASNKASEFYPCLHLISLCDKHWTGQSPSFTDMGVLCWGLNLNLWNCNWLKMNIHCLENNLTLCGQGLMTKSLTSWSRHLKHMELCRNSLFISFKTMKWRLFSSKHSLERALNSLQSNWLFQPKISISRDSALANILRIC